MRRVDADALAAALIVANDAVNRDALHLEAAPGPEHEATRGPIASADITRTFDRGRWVMRAVARATSRGAASDVVLASYKAPLDEARRYDELLETLRVETPAGHRSWHLTPLPGWRADPICTGVYDPPRDGVVEFRREAYRRAGDRFVVTWQRYRDRDSDRCARLVRGLVAPGVESTRRLVGDIELVEASSGFGRHGRMRAVARSWRDDRAYHVMLVQSTTRSSPSKMPAITSDPPPRGDGTIRP